MAFSCQEMWSVFCKRVVVVKRREGEVVGNELNVRLLLTLVASTMVAVDQRRWHGTCVLCLTQSLAVNLRCWAACHSRRPEASGDSYCAGLHR